jgi:hypothetical protein
MITCRDCGKFVSLWSNRCPFCDGIDRRISFSEKAPRAESIDVATIQEHWKRNNALMAVMILIAFASPFLSLILIGWMNVVVGLILSAVSSVVGLYAITRIREVRSRRTKNVP